MPLTRDDYVMKLVVEQMFVSCLEDTPENRLTTLYGMLDRARENAPSRNNTIYVGQLCRMIHLLIDQMETDTE